MITVVVNKYKSNYDIYIGRGSPFGNPFLIGVGGTREEVIAKYQKYFDNKIKTDPIFKEQVFELKGKVLGCFCKPHACHGDVIKEWLESNEQRESSGPSP